MSYRRRLAAIERALIADEPVLSSKFAVFNQLTDGQRPVGLEPVPRAFRPRPRPTYLAVILVLTAIAALFLTISPRVTPVTHPCHIAVTYAPVRDMPCHAYPATRR